MEVLGDTIKEEETVEGMQDSEHEHGHEDEHAHEGEDEKEYDEHVWTSMRNASVICDAIAETLEEMDPENKEISGNGRYRQTEYADLCRSFCISLSGR